MLLPEIWEHIIYLIFPYSSTIQYSSAEISTIIKKISYINKQSYTSINNPKIIRTIINNLSCHKKQNILAKQIGTPAGLNYLKKNIILYRFVNCMNNKKIKRLLTLGADPNYSPTLRTQQPLQRPILFKALNKYNTTQTLLEAGANVDVIFNEKTALHLTIERNMVETTKLLLRYNPKDLCLNHAVFYQKPAIINAILQQKDIPLAKLNSALGLAIQLSNKETIDSLIIAGAQFETYIDAIKEKFTKLTNY